MGRIWEVSPTLVCKDEDLQKVEKLYPLHLTHTTDTHWKVSVSVAQQHAPEQLNIITIL